MLGLASSWFSRARVYHGSSRVEVMAKAISKVIVIGNLGTNHTTRTQLGTEHEEFFTGDYRSFHRSTAYHPRSRQYLMLLNQPAFAVLNCGTLSIVFTVSVAIHMTASIAGPPLVPH